MYKNKKIIVITGGLNEQGKIGKVISSVPKFVDEIVAIDDASTDNTAKEAELAGATVIKNIKNMGAGYVLRKGMDYAIKKRYDIIVIIAGDNQDNPNEIKFLIEPLFEGYDFVQGSRFIEFKDKMPFFRLITTKFFNLLFRQITTSEITDASNGFRAFRSDILHHINLYQEWLNRYELEPYFLIQSIKKGYKIKEVPVSKSYNKKEGYSKMKPFIDWYRICKPLFKELFA
jgi:dolichol-phosphate mannosyltransferase